MDLLHSDDHNDKEDFQKITSNNLKAIQRKLTKLGYADGVNDGQESILQESFNYGYRDGLRIAFHLNKFKYFFQHLNTSASVNDDLHQEMSKYFQLNTGSITEVKPPQDSEQSTASIEFNEDLKEISKRQLQPFQNKINQLQLQIPITSNLLSIPQSTNFP